MTRQIQRLYVTGKNKQFKYCMASSLSEASVKLGAEARVPDADDMRTFWHKSGIGQMSDKQRIEKFGITRQAAHYWRRKGGIPVEARRDIRLERRETRIRQILEKFPNMSASAVASMAKTTTDAVRQVAADHKLLLGGRRQMPPDDALISFATGRTWREFADAVGLKLATLRQYIYARPELSERIRKVRKAVGNSRKKIDLTKVRLMGQRGMSAYAISEAMKVEIATIRSHLIKLGKEFPDEFPPPYGKRCTPSRSLDVSDGGDVRQQ